MGAIQKLGGADKFILPMALGKGGCLKVTDHSLDDIGAALSVLRKRCSEVPGMSPESEIMVPTVDGKNIDGGSYEIFHEQTASEDVQYHVVSVPEIFSTSNTTLIGDYCIDKTSGRKRKVLVVVHEYPGNTIADIDAYFSRHSSAIDDFCVLSMHVSSAGKDMDSVQRVVDAAIGLRMSKRDVLVVVGGGTLMDIVGFAAAIFKGGVPYVRIPTTLVGMIDAGVGIKTGVNFKNHKSLIGRYFPPVACLNDPETFLPTLPQREFACGVAEAIKMAIVKSPRLFEVVERHHRNVGYNAYTHELIHISIRTMLEELQPNLYEHDLRRLVDFGHEFGHIVESLAKHEIPHGECVAIGMAISSFLAHLSETLSCSDLERILNCILSMGLPIYVTDYDCCNPEILWAKIRTEGIEHKDGMLWLAVPEIIGRGGFLDEISSIDAEMVNKAVLSLRWYAGWYREENVLRLNIEDLSVAVCLGMTQSGKTLKTVMLMNALRERFDSAGLDYREHFVWLTNMRQSERDCASGEAVIRSIKEHDWKKVDMVPLTVDNHADINALFCAPHSVGMFLPLTLLFSKDLKAVRRTYQQYRALRDGIVRDILLKAYFVASSRIEHIQLVLDESIAPAMVSLVTQLIEQGLGSKQVGFNPRVCVTSCGQVAGFEIVALPMPTETSAAVKIMLTMNTLSAFVAIVAYHRRINFVTHPKVNLYKRRAVELMAAAEVEQKVFNPGSITAEIIAYLSNNLQTRFVEVLCYGQVPVSHQQSIKAWLASGLASRTPTTSIAVVPGEAWNHSRYQAAVQTEDTVYIVLSFEKYCSQVEGVSKGAIYSNTRTLQAIALATYETLLPKALRFRVGEGYLGEKVVPDAA